MSKIRACVLTLSDKGSQGARKDESGPAIKKMLLQIGAEVVRYEILPDDMELIKSTLIECAQEADLILTTGGTGLAPRDVTPDATREVIDHEVPGMAEAMRAEGLKKTPRAVLSRAVVGVRGTTLIVNLPGSLKAVQENLGVILEVIPHAIMTLKGESADCGR